ncbi:uncharacterized protein LOC131032436 isoform X1 [Cryptomeria japonica]|uniref:uncharacterized protein LOC131032436 isoform X1 n=2 Tax=Cryptomeria japonica TaxID=3369 RepID=UPI0027DA18F5|nr:uncharacterized protein LOC131032436 isoform X1 [Cryptomeria japonica]
MAMKGKKGDPEENARGCIQWQAQVALNNLKAHSGVLAGHWMDISCYYSALISATQVSKANILEPLSCLLLCLSSALTSNNFDCPDKHSIFVCIMGIQIKFKLEDIHLLHNLLFQELFKEIKMIFSVVNFSSQKFSSNDGNHCPCLKGPNDTSLLLRCSIRILPLLEFDTGLSQIATTRLVSLFQKLCSSGLVRSLLSSKETQFGDFGFLMTCEVTSCTDVSTMAFAKSEETSIGNAVHCLSALLEVFVDELILHPNLGKAFSNVNMESTGLSSRFKTPSIFGKHIDHSLEAMFVHCLLSMSNKISNLSMANARSTRISLPAAVLLLDYLDSIKAPKIFQAHVLVLVAEAIAVDSIPTYGELPKMLSLSQLVSVFESAVKLYRKHSSLMDTVDDCDCLETPVLESCLIKHRNLQAELDVSSDSLLNLMWNEKDCIQQYKCFSSHQSSSSSTRTCGTNSSNLLNLLCMYIKEHEASLDNLSRKEISGILHCTVTKSFSGVGESDIPSSAHANIHPGTYLLAAILQLMGSSLSRILCIIKRKGDSGHSTPLDQNLLEAYHYTIDLIRNLIVNCHHTTRTGIALSKIMAKMLGTNKHSVGPAVSYFVGELYLKCQMGSELLCKGYVIFLKSLMSLFVLEHGGIDCLRALMESSELSADSSDSTSQTVLNQGEKLLERQRPLSIEPRLVPVLTNFLKKRQQYLSRHRVHDLGYTFTHSKVTKGEMAGREEEADISESIIKSKKANGNITYIESVIKIQGQWTEDPSDLSDFIVCKEGKDYSAWLQKRRKMRQKKYDREFFRRMKERKELLLLLSGDNKVQHM